MKKNEVVYIPFPQKRDNSNEYNINMIDVISENYYVRENLADFYDLPRLFKTKAIVLNWFENKLDIKRKCQLIIHKVFGARIIWVFHNKIPHNANETENKLIKNVNWLANCSNKIIIHSKSSKRFIPGKKSNTFKAVYIPHIMYNIRKNTKSNILMLSEKYHINENDFVFTIFGFIKPYKRIELAIEAFKHLQIPNSKLIIAGRLENSFIGKKYCSFLKEICKSNDNIILDFRYLTNNELSALLSLTDVVVMPYINNSSMNSGVMIQSFSNSKTVISPEICMAMDYSDKGFVYIFTDNLEEIMLIAYKNGKKINRSIGEKAYEYMKNNNNKEIVKKRLERII